jgi:STE24 endopeptidase
MDNPYLIFVLGLMIFSYLLDVIVETLNVKHIRADIPEEYVGLYDTDKYAKSQEYLKTNTRFDLLSSSMMLPISIAFILLGGFPWVDGIARGAGFGLIGTGLLFTLILMGLQMALNLPFSYYSTFVIEERFGFNKTSKATFVLDFVKGLVLSSALLAALLAIILWFFDTAGGNAWWICWIIMTAFVGVLTFLAPVVILPLFNKFEPLEDGELKTAVQAYAEGQGYKIKGIFQVDGSKRSTKANAYFTGFGATRRIALFDTLINNHTIPELVNVLAHEIGHCKLKHIKKMMIVQIGTFGLMFYLLSIFMHKPGMYAAFQMDYTSLVGGSAPIYAGLIFFQFLFAPINLFLGIILNKVSRKHEFEADAYAVTTTGDSESMIQALKKLTVDTLGNLYPHPLKVFLEYSHPPMLERIKAMRGIKS